MFALSNKPFIPKLQLTLVRITNQFAFSHLIDYILHIQSRFSKHPCNMRLLYGEQPNYIRFNLKTNIQRIYVHSGRAVCWHRQINLVILFNGTQNVCARRFYGYYFLRRCCITLQNATDVRRAGRFTHGLDGCWNGIAICWVVLVDVCVCAVHPGLWVLIAGN